MANSSQALKRVRQNLSRRLHNKGKRAATRTAVKSLLKAVDSADGDIVKDRYRRASSALDRAAGDNLIHKNKAARLKSRMNKRILKARTN